MRIIVTGGGTGGHIFPALEIAKAVQLNAPQADVVFVGNTNSLEETMAKAAGIKFYGITTKKIVGQSKLQQLRALVYLKLGVMKALWFLIKDRPQAVVGVGGYVCAPMLIASFLLGIKRYVCEQNVVPGLANQWLAKIATKVFISFEESRRYFPQTKTFLTGNPVRREFFSKTPSKKSEHMRVLVTGGSLGARFLNHHIPEAFATLKNDCPNLVITHQTGKHDVDDVSKRYQKNQIEADVVSFISDMPRAFLSHDLLVSRAGATVCAEIMAAGMSSILIPYPHAFAHQRHNAEALSKHGAAITLMEDENFAHRLALVIKDLYSDPTKLVTMREQAKNLGSQDAAAKIVNHILHH